MKNGCAHEFTGDFRSYCHSHFDSNTLNTANSHESDEMCAICSLEMSEHSTKDSLQLICCTDSKWYHKQCLKQMAFALKDNFKCPSCSNCDDFRENMLSNGVFIPDATYLSENVDATPIAKRKRVHKDWIFAQTFESKLQAIAAVKAEKCWSYFYDNKSSLGVRVNYRCNLMKFGGQQCAAGVYLLYDSESSNVHLYRAETIHTHDDVELSENAVNKMSAEVEAEIRSMFEQKRKPKGILYDLVRKGLKPPKKAKLTTFLAKLRREKFGSQKLHYGSLEK